MPAGRNRNRGADSLEAAGNPAAGVADSLEVEAAGILAAEAAGILAAAGRPVAAVVQFVEVEARLVAAVVQLVEVEARRQVPARAQNPLLRPLTRQPILAQPATAKSA